MLRDGGQALKGLLDEMRADAVAPAFVAPLAEAAARVERAAASVVAGAAEDADLPGAASADLLELTGLAIYAWLWARMARRVHDNHPKQHLARFFYAKLLPRTLALEATIAAGASTVMALAEERF